MSLNVQERRKKYGQWTEGNMKEAIIKYKSGRYGLNEICRMYEIPKPTFIRHFKSSNVRANEGHKALGRCSIFSVEQERQLEEHILTLESMFYGITIKDVRRGAYQLAEKNNIKHSFNIEKRMAGKK